MLAIFNALRFFYDAEIIFHASLSKPATEIKSQASAIDFFAKHFSFPVSETPQPLFGFLQVIQTKWSAPKYFAAGLLLLYWGLFVVQGGERE